MDSPNRTRRLVVIAVCLLFATATLAADDAAKPISVFAAASLKESLDEAATAFQASTGHAVAVTYAASSALARQIEQAAPADVFVSADREWMDWLQSRGLIDESTRSDLLGNSLVLVAPSRAVVENISFDARGNFVPELGKDGRLSLALTDSVPAGKYARAALESLGLWAAVQPRVVESENVRAALVLVARAEAPLGVVYATDAKAEPRVKIVATFPETSHPPIIYPVARVRASTHAQAAAFVAWLESDEARAIFARYGFASP